MYPGKTMSCMDNMGWIDTLKTHSSNPCSKLSLKLYKKKRTTEPLCYQLAIESRSLVPCWSYFQHVALKFY